MTYAYMLAGENLDLAKAEVEGFLKSQGFEPSLNRKSRLLLSEDHPDQLKRLSLIQEISEVLEKTNKLETNYRPEDSFAVRAFNLTNKQVEEQEIEEKLGKILETEANKVDLTNPDEEIRVYILENQYIIGKLIENIDRGLFEKRTNEKRPFSSPVSLDPVHARVLVNLSEISAEEHVLDPFCGTGGILIEAGLCGIGVHGLDMQEKMVEGTKENLEEYGIIVHDIRQGEISEAKKIFDRKFEALISDLPYGKSSKKKSKPVKTFLNKASTLSKDKVVFMYNEPEIEGYSHDYQFYVHKNLTRYIYVLDSF